MAVLLGFFADVADVVSAFVVVVCLLWRTSVRPQSFQNREEVGSDVDNIKRAADLVVSYKGNLDEALTAIDTVGGFVESCGGAEKAKSALEAYEAVVAVVKK